MSTNDELQIPNAAKKDANSFKLLRVWVTSQGLYGGVRLVALSAGRMF